MKTLDFVGYKREDLGKSAAKKLRSEALVPCVLYGGEENVNFSVPMILFKDLVYTPNVHKVSLNVEGKEYVAVLQDIDFHPVSEVILHADFLELVEGKAVKMEVPLKFVGSAPGLQQGGKFMQKVRKVKVSATPENLPEFLEVDISKLQLGKNVRVSDIKQDNFEVLASPLLSVASVEVPRALRGKKSEDEEEEA